MGAAAQYERTKDKSRMFTSAQLAAAIIKETKRQFARPGRESNLNDVLPARTATSIEYKAHQTKARIWNAGGEKVNIDLPLEDGWRRSDGNPFGVPNGKPSTKDDPEALYLYRYRDRDFSGPVGLGDIIVFGVGRRRDFDAYDGFWSGDSGVAIIVRATLRCDEEIPMAWGDFELPNVTVRSRAIIEAAEGHEGLSKVLRPEQLTAYRQLLDALAKKR